MNIKVGEYDVLDSGTVSSFDDSSIVFELSHKHEDITLALKFADRIAKDEAGKLVDSMDFGQIAKGSITLNGWDDPMGIGFSQPIQLGTIGGRNLLLLLRIYGMQKQKNRMVSYTWLLGGEDNAS